MINFDDYASDNRINHNPNWPYIPDHPYRQAAQDLDKQIHY